MELFIYTMLLPQWTGNLNCHVTGERGCWINILNMSNSCVIYTSAPVVTDLEKKARSQTFLVLEHQIPDGLAGEWIDTCSWLIQDDHFRPSSKRQCNRHLALHSTCNNDDVWHTAGICLDRCSWRLLHHQSRFLAAAYVVPILHTINYHVLPSRGQAFC